MKNKTFFDLHSLFAMVAGFVFSFSLFAAPINTMIVEADDDKEADGLQYAPVNFAGSATVVSGGITYHALSDQGSDTISTYSSHAATVRNRLLAADGPNDPIEDIYCLFAGDFLSDYVRTGSPSTTATRPALVDNEIKLVNHSWIGGVSGDTTDTYNIDAVRRMNYMIRREDLVMVSGAVSRSSGELLPWANFNGIAVRGTQSFNPANSEGIGKRHADLWGPKTGTGSDEDASYSTPGVSGYAAALIDLANSQNWSNGLNGIRHEVVKSVLMTGADKTDFSNNGFTSWTNNTDNNLDDRNGAGRVDYQTSERILLGGPQAMATVSGGSINSPTITESMAGWWYEASLAASGRQALIVDLSELFLTDLSATLAWDITQAETEASVPGPPGSTAPRLDTTDDGVIFANLLLEFLPVVEDNGSYLLGDPLGIAGLSSMSMEDNVQHLYFANGMLDSGLYAFVISSGADFAWDYGFSYIITAVPEPTTFILLLLLSGWMLVGRRRRC